MGTATIEASMIWSKAIEATGEALAFQVAVEILEQGLSHDRPLPDWDNCSGNQSRSPSSGIGQSLSSRRQAQEAHKGQAVDASDTRTIGRPYRL